MRQALENEFKCVHRTELDPATGKTITYKDYAKQTLTPEEEAAFFDRLDEMMARREASVKALDEKLAQEKYPFKPTITSKLRKKGNQSDESSSEEEDDEDGTGAVQAFLRRYREDLEERRGKYPGASDDKNWDFYVNSECMNPLLWRSVLIYFFFNQLFNL